MSKTPSSQSKKSNRRNSSTSPASQRWRWLIWAALAAVAGLMISGWLQEPTVERLTYADLVELLEQTRYVERRSEQLEDGFSGVLEVVAPRTEQGRRFSRPRQVVVGTNQVTGRVDYQPISATGEALEPVREVEFRVAKNDAQQTDEQLQGLLAASRIDWSHQGPPSAWVQFAPLLLPLLILGVLLTILMRRLGGPGSPMAFARSRGKLYAQEELPVTFQDVAGIEEAVEEVREVVDFLQHPQRYERLGGRIPKGVLLVGPPGTGKTLLARAIAGEAGVPFFSLSGSDFVEMFVGVGAARVRDMFQQAKAKAPCIIFIDELDALGKSRSGNMVGSHDEREQTLNALLVEMDGFGANTGIIVVAATNRPETLDPALLRPGRFDRNVLVDRPDKQGRLDILKVHVRNVRLAENLELQRIASITPGFAGADLANLVNEAALLAARRDKDQVEQADFDEAVERVTAGLEKKQRVMNQDEKRRVAYHEAAHALVAYSLPNTDPVHKVSIIPRGVAALGYTMQRPSGDRYLMTQAELEAQMQVLLAGTLAEQITFSDISTGAQNDLERASAIARSMVLEFGMSRLGRVAYKASGASPFLGGSSELPSARNYSEQTAREIDLEVKRLIDQCVLQTEAILTQRRAALEAITERLIEVESIDADELASLVENSLAGPRVVPGSDPNQPLGTAGSATPGIGLRPAGGDSSQTARAAPPSS